MILLVFLGACFVAGGCLRFYVEHRRRRYTRCLANITRLEIALGIREPERFKSVRYLLEEDRFFGPGSVIPLTPGGHVQIIKSPYAFASPEFDVETHG